MVLQDRSFLETVAFQAPQDCRPVASSGGQRRAIRGKGHARYRSPVAMHARTFFRPGGSQIPHLDRSITVATGQGPAVGSKRKVLHEFVAVRPWNAPRDFLPLPGPHADG